MNPTAASRPSGRAVLSIPIDKVCPSPYQPRQNFSESSIAELAESIRQHGLLSPLLVRRIDAGRFELIAGERRLRALTRLNRTHADAIVLSAYDRDCALIALIENLQRENLHYLDEAEAYRNIIASHEITQEKLAQELGMSPSAIANRLRLLKLPDSVRTILRQHNLSERHGRALLRLSTEEEQLYFIRMAASQKMSVKQLESVVEHRIKSSPSTCKPRIGGLVRDNRIVINAVLETVRELRRIGVCADSRIEEHDSTVDVIVTIRTPQKEQNPPTI